MVLNSTPNSECLVNRFQFSILNRYDLMSGVYSRLGAKKKKGQ